MKIQLKRYTIILLVCTISLFFSHSGRCQVRQKNPSGIQFTGSTWSVILKRAAATHRYIFVDAYTSWCGPCKELKATTFIDKAAASYFNSHFVNFSIDVEKGEGVALAESWGVQSYPTLYIFDPQGKPIAMNEGFLDAQALIKFGKDALSYSPKSN